MCHKVCNVLHGDFFISAMHKTSNISGPMWPNGLKFYTVIEQAWHGSVSKIHENWGFYQLVNFGLLI